MAGTYSAAVSALASRLTASTAAGKVLAGVTFIPYPHTEEEGQRQLPCVRMFPADLTETPVPRGPTKATVTVRLIVATQRSEGVAANLALCEKVLDATEIDPATSLVDVRLGGNVRAPASIKMEGSHTTELSINGQIMLELTPMKVPQHGKRRL
jgi:hypothetical protein